MKKLIAGLALVGLTLSGCGSPVADSAPVEHGEPTHVLIETRSQTLGEFLAPPTPAEPQESIEGLLSPTSPWQPAPAPWQVDLPEVADLPPLPQGE